MRAAIMTTPNSTAARQSFRDEAARAWQDYKDSGLHVTQNEVDAWVASLGTRKPKRRPKRHEPLRRRDMT
jgi:predicted transcriptional regulator